MSDLRTFSAKRGCPKCGCPDVGAFHMRAEEFRSRYDCDRREEREHIHRTCQRCRYSWDEAPLDAAARGR